MLYTVTNMLRRYMMKKIIFISIAVIIMCTSLVLSLMPDKPEVDDTETPAVVDDGKANHLKINIRVYSMVDTKKLTKLDEENREIIIGAYDFVVGYDDGETVTANTILLALADARNANVELTSSGTVDKITFDGVTYSSGRKLNLDRRGVEQNSNKDTFEVYYYDVMIWEWTLNGTLIERMSEATFKDGDQLILTLNYDNTSKAGYELADEIDAEREETAE